MKFLKLLGFFICASASLLGAEQGESLADKLTHRRNQSALKVPRPIKAQMKAATEALKKKGLAKKALGVGKKLPVIELINSKSKKFLLNDFIGNKTVVITFYRGGWCPYCMLELDQYQAMITDFEKAGVDIIAISPDSVMESRKTRKKRNLSYKLFSDPNNTAAKKLGLAFKVSENIIGIYEKFGIDLKKSQGNSANELPLPGTYVVDSKGVIRYSFVDPDYTVRAEPSVVLEIAHKLVKSK